MKTLAVIAAFSILLATGAPAPAPPAAAKKTAKKSGKAGKQVARPASKPPVKGPVRSRPRVAGKKVTKPRVVRRAGQQAPSADRYREIQQALADKGYLKGDPTGRWDEESVEAFRRFEQDQNLKPDGKLDSLALIALGLGPKRTSSTTSAEQ